MIFGEICSISVVFFAHNHFPEEDGSEVGVEVNLHTVVTNVPGMGTLIADAASLFHMKLPSFSTQTQSQLASRFPRLLPYCNPLNVTGKLNLTELMEAAMEAMKDPNMDVILLGLQPNLIEFEEPIELANRLADRFGPGKTEKPFLIVEFGGKQEDDRILRMTLKERGIAVYNGPEEALRGLEKLMDYTEFLKSEDLENEVSLNCNSFK